MRCSQCGAQNEDTARRCEECGAFLARSYQSPPVRPLSSASPSKEGSPPVVALLGFLFAIMLLCGSVSFVVYGLLQAEVAPTPTVAPAPSAPGLSPTPAVTPVAVATPSSAAFPIPSVASPPALPSTPSPQIRPKQVSPTPTATVVIRDEDSGYRLSQVRYGLHPDRARIVLDLVVGPSVAGEPAYIVTNTPQRVVVRLGISAAQWTATPNDAIVRRLEVTPTGAHTANLTVDLAVPVPRVVDTVLTGPDRLVFDLYPR